MYVGQTRLDLNARLTEQRSVIKAGKSLTVAVHLNETCPGIENLSVILVEEVLKKDLDEFMGLYSIKDILRLHIHEQYWMA